MADVESKSIPHELPSSHWLKAPGQCVLERYLSATMKLSELYYRKLFFKLSLLFSERSGSFAPIVLVTGHFGP